MLEPPFIDPDATRLPGARPNPAPAPNPNPDSDSDSDSDSDPDATRIPVRPAAAGEATVIVRSRLRAPHPSGAATTPIAPPAPQRRSSAALPAGFVLHEYRVEKVLGQGGFGITYLATDINLRAPVAIKEYLPEDIAFRAGDASVAPHGAEHHDRYRTGLEMFLVEARTLATFRHPHIVRVARFFEAHRTAYMVLEYERGSALRSWWPQHGSMGERGLVERLQPLFDGLATVHAAGYLHRDIKPDNIQVRQDDGRFVLLDFGSVAQTVTLADQMAVAVTPGYAPIEQYGHGFQGPWTDVYALGATLYWAVTGHKPPDAESRAAGVSMPAAAEVAHGRYGARFLQAIDWALTLDPTQRPRDLAQWRQALFADHAGRLGLKEALLHQGDPSSASAGPGPLASRASGHWAARAGLLLQQLGSPAAWPLAVKMTLAMLCTALLPMLVTAAWNLRASQEALTVSELAQAELLAHNAAGRLAQLIDDSRRLAAVLGTDADFANWLATPDPAQRQALVDKTIAAARANPDIHLVMVMDRSGTTQICNDPAVAGRNFRFRQYFQEALAGRPFVTGITVGSVAGQSGVFFSTPVRDAAGGVLGAVVLRIHASAFASILDGVRHQSALAPFLIDGDGVLVHHPREDLMFRSLMPLPEKALAAIRADQRFRRDRIESLDQPVLAAAMVGASAPGHVRYRSHISGVDEIAGYAPVPGHSWVVGVTEPRSVFEAPLDQLYRQLMWSVAVVGLIFTSLALAFARSIVRPIQALTAAAWALKAGDFEHATVSVRRRDEVGQLARTFNVMIDVLRQRERERERPAAGDDAARSTGGS